MYKNEIPADYLIRQSENYRSKHKMETEQNELEHRPDVEVAKLQQELAEERERYLRLAADFDNHRKRVNRDQERRAASQKEALVRDLLPAIDNLERALNANAGENLREGVQMTYQQLLGVLQRHGFEPREDLGQRFDGRFHDGIAVGCKPEMPDQSIIEVWERGWMRGSEMFRPAKVLVNNLEAGTAPSKVADTAASLDGVENGRMREAVPQ
jgi:molecular chaperone GrpE